MVSKILIPLLLPLLVFTCRYQPGEENNRQRSEKYLVATLFHQHAAEMRALSYQAYNLAKRQLPEIIKESGNPSDLAIVFDLDETVLDNSPYQAQAILSDFSYPVGWEEWCMLADAKALPGAVDFIKEATSMGFQIVYISNRKEHLREATVENLKKLGIAPASEDHLLLHTGNHSKEERRIKVSQKYRIVMLFGDNLADFHGLYDRADTFRRSHVTDSLKDYFGTRYIILPNAMYGDWLSALYEYNYELKEEQKSDLFRKKLQGFQFQEIRP